VCNAGGNAPDGTSCGSNKVCKAGNCVSCISGGACQHTNVCMKGVYGCSTGSQVCDAAGPKPNGTDCSGSGCPRQCSGGICETYVGWGYVADGGTCVASAYYCPSVTPPPPPAGFSSLPTPAGCDDQGCPTGQPFCQSNFCKTCSVSSCAGQCP
jgi:hypothetical protein